MQDLHEFIRNFQPPKIIWATSVVAVFRIFMVHESKKGLIFANFFWLRFLRQTFWDMELMFANMITRCFCHRNPKSMSTTACFSTSHYLLPKTTTTNVPNSSGVTQIYLRIMNGKRDRMLHVRQQVSRCISYIRRMACWIVVARRKDSNRHSIIHILPRMKVPRRLRPNVTIRISIIVGNRGTACIRYVYI